VFFCFQICFRVFFYLDVIYLAKSFRYMLSVYRLFATILQCEVQRPFLQEQPLRLSKKQNDGERRIKTRLWCFSWMFHLGHDQVLKAPPSPETADGRLWGTPLEPSGVNRVKKGSSLHVKRVRGLIEVQVMPIDHRCLRKESRVSWETRPQSNGYWARKRGVSLISPVSKPILIVPPL
jgi:hypothetical protein